MNRKTQKGKRDFMNCKKYILQKIVANNLKSKKPKKMKYMAPRHEEMLSRPLAKNPHGQFFFRSLKDAHQSALSKKSG